MKLISEAKLKLHSYSSRALMSHSELRAEFETFLLHEKLSLFRKKFLVLLSARLWYSVLHNKRSVNFINF